MRTRASGRRRVAQTMLWIAMGGMLAAPRLFAQDASAVANVAKVRTGATPLVRAEPCEGPEAVCALLQTFLTAFNARDFDAFRSTFADEISFFVDRPYPPQRLDGRAAAEAIFARGFAPYAPGASGPKPPLPSPLVPSHLRVQTFGDVAIISFELVRPTELARRTMVAHREGNGWRIVHIHASSADTPP